MFDEHNYQWEYNKSIVEDLNTTIDWSDPIYKHGGWDVAPVVIESHKLLFFTIPKNTCSEFKILFRRMMGFKDWKTDMSVVSVHHPKKNGLKYLGSYPKKQQLEFMTSPDWTRAVFVRDPKERVLSAYMDKALNFFFDVNGKYIKNQCCQMRLIVGSVKLLESERSRIQRKFPHCLPLFPYEKNTTVDGFPFEKFVQTFMKRCRDPHWEPQSNRMHAKTWKSINFVGHFEDLQRDGHALLHKISGFEEFGREGWGPGNGTIFQTNFAGHATSAGSKTELFYSKNEVELAVLKYYRSDYEHPIMNMTKPASWEKLMARQSTKSIKQQNRSSHDQK